jgi:hypothetical protein
MKSVVTNAPGLSIYSRANVAIFGSVTCSLESRNQQNWLPGRWPTTIDAHDWNGASMNLAMIMLITYVIVHTVLLALPYQHQTRIGQCICEDQIYRLK